jgi:hypothetical protein
MKTKTQFRNEEMQSKYQRLLNEEVRPQLAIQRLAWEYDLSKDTTERIVRGNKRFKEMQQ